MARRRTGRLISLIEKVIEGTGKWLAWLTLLMVLVTVAIVGLRYGFDTGAIAAQESVIYMHACVFMLGIAYTSHHDEHVRVDVLYSHLSARGQAWVNLSGHLLFLLPCSITFLWLSLPYVNASWRILEGSSEVGGIPGIYLLKTLIPIMAISLLAQGLVEIHRALATLRGSKVDNPAA